MICLVFVLSFMAYFSKKHLVYVMVPL